MATPVPAFASVFLIVSLRPAALPGSRRGYACGFISAMGKINRQTYIEVLTPGFNLVKIHTMLILFIG
jgi:hypothetical protein